MDPEAITSRLHLGQQVLDRDGVLVGRVAELKAPDPLALSDVGRRVGIVGDDIAGVLGGARVRSLPTIPPAEATSFVRAGYIKVEAHGGLEKRVAALPDIDVVDDDGVHLAVPAEELPIT